MHLALGAIPFVLAYALARGRARAGLVAAGVAVAGGIAVWALTLRDTVERPFSEVERYSATLADFLSRNPAEFERFVYLGWLLPARRRRRPRDLVFQKHNLLPRPLAAVLGLGALIPCLLALGANLPGYEWLWEWSPLHATRVPERLMPIACLSLAALAAVAVGMALCF